jgi:hypothetical protein
MWLPAGTPVLAKDTFSLAAQPEIVDAVRATERATLVLLGFETDTCVDKARQTVRTAAERFGARPPWLAAG